MKGLTEGRIVHYVLPDNGDGLCKSVGEHRPAIVVLVCPKEWGYPEGAVNLQVFIDNSNDVIGNNTGILWATSVQYSEDPIEGTWHWIEPA